MARKKTPPAAPEPEPQPASPSLSPDPVPSAPTGRPAKSPARSRPKAPAGDPVAQARALVTQAGRSPDPKRQKALLAEAIRLDPDCAEALLLMAEQAKTRKAALGLFERAVAAAERALGPEIFRDMVGHFWLVTETRPYMQARASLADALWTSGRRAEAVDHLHDMLRLNPGDNQGLRYVLAGWLLALDRLDDLRQLLDQYDEDSTAWTFTRTLMAFRTAGDTPATRKTLGAARKSNKHVVDYLLGRKDLPGTPPPYYSPGGVDDAVLYVASSLGSWKATPGALAWVRTVTTRRKRKAVEDAPAGPSPAAVRSLGRLPAEEDTWQADFRQFARRIEVGGERIRPWMVLVSSRSNDQVLAHAMLDHEPDGNRLWDIVTRAMVSPAAGEPHRPTEIQIRPTPAWHALRDSFAAIGIECVPTDDLDQIDFLFENLAQHLDGSRQPGLLDMPGVTPERVGQFYRAAAEFYRRAPWRALGFEAVARIECDRYDSGPWYAVVMGQSGLTLGLALYEDLNLLRRMYQGKLSEEEGARKTVALTVTFDDPANLAEADLDAIEEHDWPLAAPEAYPSFFRKERGLSMRPPLSWEIDLMVGCLTALPDFIARRAVDDTTRELVAVADAAGQRLELGLAWIPEPT